MSTRRITRAIAPLAIAAAALVGCTGDNEPDPTAETDPPAPVVQLGGPGEQPQVLTDEQIADLPTTPTPTEGDVDFVSSMIHHHQQALEMIALIETRSDNDDIALMAERMRVSQVDEIALLEAWLTTNGRPVPDHTNGHGAAAMPGMLTDSEMAALEASTGDDFDTLFLVSMIRHHEGARVMVQALYDGGDGQEPTVFQLAEGISIDQAVEVARMTTMLAELEAG